MKYKKYIKPKINIKKLKFNLFLNPRKFFAFADGCKLCGGDIICCNPCFLSDTKILMADASYKNIQDIKTGDKIISYDLNHKTQVKVVVRKLLIHPDDRGGYYIINNRINVTGNHRVWINNKDWQTVNTLKVGDTFLHVDETMERIGKIEKKEGVNTVYNLEIDDENHNYFAENILVHNAKVY